MNLAEDKLHQFLDGCFSVGIKDPVAFLISKRPQVYDWLAGGIFPRGILPTDIDGEVEINGHFLRLEFKHEFALQNGLVPKGQLKLLKALTDTKKFTVFIIGTDSNSDPTCVEIYSARRHTKLQSTDRNGIRELCRQWAEKADKGKL